jgi:hypothetical protein
VADRGGDRAQAPAKAVDSVRGTVAATVTAKDADRAGSDPATGPVAADSVAASAVVALLMAVAANSAAAGWVARARPTREPRACHWAGAGERA